MHFNLHRLVPQSFEINKRDNSLWDTEQSLSVPSVIQVVAPSGTGKSTLISILTGLRSDYQGIITYNNSDLSSFGITDWSNYRSHELSVVYQDLRLFNQFTVKENIELSNLLVGRSKNIIRDDWRLLAEKLGLHNKIDTVVKHLSYGQMQRVAILRAISKPYRWLILDEPFSHLDHVNAENAWQMIKSDAAEKNAGIIIATLDPYPFIQPNSSFSL